MGTVSNRTGGSIAICGVEVPTMAKVTFRTELISKEDLAKLTDDGYSTRVEGDNYIIEIKDAEIKDAEIKADEIKADEIKEVKYKAREEVDDSNGNKRRRGGTQ